MSLIDAYSRLKAFRDNFPDKSSRGVSTDYINEYHSIVDIIDAETDIDLEQYRIPASAINPVVASSNYMNGQVTYSNESYCKIPFFKMKVDGLLNRFQIMLNQPEPEVAKSQIGFK